jgi:hypothetical protein
MSELLKAGQVLGRSEMKKIIAGSGGCSSTNCWMCTTGGWMCATPGGGGEYDQLPNEPGTSCSWGICSQCC